MDRFKGQTAEISKFVEKLYIPVWIDLKPTVKLRELTSRKTLHSSMDRFKVVPTFSENIVEKLYIPVWIDLKSCHKITSLIVLISLHSSMDRFKETKDGQHR